MERIRSVIRDLGVQLKTMRVKGLDMPLGHEESKASTKSTDKRGKGKTRATLATPPLSVRERDEIDKMLKIFRDHDSPPLDEMMSDDFRRAYNNFFLEIHKAKSMKWKSTTQETAIRLVNILASLIKL